MQAFIGSKLLSSNVAQSTQKPFEIYDSRLSGFTLRVQPTGVRSYYARFGRNRQFALGKVGTLRPDEARERCQKVLGNVAHGRHPLHGLNGEGVALGQFIEEAYVPWVKARILSRLITGPACTAVNASPRTLCSALGTTRMTRGRCDLLGLHRNGLAPSTPCRFCRRTPRCPLIEDR
jgi:hypothetical protein